MSTLRSLPSVDRLLQTARAQEWIACFGRSLTLDAIRSILAEARQHYPVDGDVPQEEELIEQTGEMLQSWVSPSLQPVINATGVILHTNLGRAPLSQATVQAIREAGMGYTNLEYDLERGKRGSRLVHAEDLLKRLTAAEAALVVNNNASALLLVLAAFARRRGVVISRSQLVEIGGGFRVPDVMKQSGARLVEVGATNRVHLSDYEEAIAGNGVSLVLRAHRSNFQIIGFTSEPTLGELAQLAHRSGLPLADDLGSGSLLDTARFGLAHEPMVQESVASGADLVCFSGDKLLGGPQAGIILGRSGMVAKLKEHPLARALRADKLCLAGLSATLLHYLKGEAEREIPIWRMISTSPESLRARAEHWASVLGQGEVLASQSTIGGGSLPGETIPAYVLGLQVSSPNHFLTHLRKARPPVVARLENERVIFDPRTVLLEQDNALTEILINVLAISRQ